LQGLELFMPEDALRVLPSKENVPAVERRTIVAKLRQQQVRIKGQLEGQLAELRQLAQGAASEVDKARQGLSYLDRSGDHVDGSTSASSAPRPRPTIPQSRWIAVPCPSEDRESLRSAWAALSSSVRRPDWFSTSTALARHYLLDPFGTS
jgi:hypothetical protein